MLFLIQKNELDISNISLHLITDQYLQYVNLMRELDFDLASEFLVMAAALIHLKSRRLLPNDDLTGTELKDILEKPLDEAEILKRLKEYQRFQDAAKTLSELPKLDETVFARPNVLPPEKQFFWKEVELTEMILAMQDVLRRTRKRTRVIIRESISIPERIGRMAKLLSLGEMKEFTTLLPESSVRIDVVGTFVALLEMARLKKIRVYQAEAFGSLFIQLVEEIGELDPKLVTGFQYRAHQNVTDLAMSS